MAQLLSAFHRAASSNLKSHANSGAGVRDTWNPSTEYVNAAWKYLQSREAERGTLVNRQAGRYFVPEEERGGRRNRYADIRAYKPTNVILPPPSAYVNASYVFEPSLFPTSPAPYPWIATQGPLRNTLFEFYLLFFEASGPPKAIVQLTGLQEGGRVKCERYVPFESETLSIDEDVENSTRKIVVQLQDVKRDSERCLIRSKLRVSLRSSQESEERTTEIDHFEFLDWRDHSVPDSEESLLNFIKTVLSVNDAHNPPPPIVIHCSAGVGRTGTLIAISTLLHNLSILSSPDPPRIQPSQPSALTQTEGLQAIWEELNGDDDKPRGIGRWERKANADIRNQMSTDPVVVTVDLLREQRNLMVQTVQQLVFVYNCFRFELQRNTQ
ncbi:phosphatases II [Atractiella rhizophila]|nr:phosphatases II [Atractiella rhizophila]